MTFTVPPRVWAPIAREVSLVARTAPNAGRSCDAGTGVDADTRYVKGGDAPTLPGQPLPMTYEGEGWWTGPALASGTDYGFVVDGAGPFPDPRSAWQPYGVHGLSRVFDAHAFSWSDGQWSGRDARGAVFYEIHVGTFTPAGTLDAIIDHLPTLAQRGIDIIELMPVAAFPGKRGWGYDGVALYAVHDPYGGPEALQRLVNAAHDHGIGVCVDVVYNHLGPDGNYLARFGPYFTAAHETPWGWAVNLDQDHAGAVREFIIDNALRWFEDFHVDALRLDAVHALVDTSPTHILAELSTRTAQLSARLNRPLSLVAESDENLSATVTAVGRTATSGRAGLGMTAQWADDVHHAIHAYLTGQRHGYYVDFGSIETLDKALRRVFVHDGGYSSFRRRAWGEPVPDDVDRRRFVVFAANHDQIGNRALGDRPAASLSPAAQAASLAIVLLGPFTPLLFMGEEYGETTPFMFFTDHTEPLGSAVTQGRMREFAHHGWDEVYGHPISVPDPQDEQTFRRSTLASDPVLTRTQQAILDWHHALMQIRPLTLEPGAWQRWPVGAYERAPRQLVISGPVSIWANLSTTPMPLPQPVTGDRVLATFGFSVDAPSAVASSVTLVPPEAVMLVRNTR